MTGARVLMKDFEFPSVLSLFHERGKSSVDITKNPLLDYFFIKGENDVESENFNDHIDFSLVDLPVFNKLYEFFTITKDDAFGSLYSFIENEARGCDNKDRELQMTAVGIAFLKLFIQKNWLGPDIPIDVRILQMIELRWKEDILKHLLVDGENIVSVVEHPELLYLSQIILENAWRNFKVVQAVKLWYLRCLFIHQQILEEFSPQLFNNISNIIIELEKELKHMPKNDAVFCHLEFARIFMYYENIHKSKLELKNATELSGIKISWSGALGKRTKFQKEDLAQLILKVDLREGEKIMPSFDETCCCGYPKDIVLDDEVRLDKIKYVDNSQNSYPDLTKLQLAVLLGNLFQIQKSQPKDSLADEELQSFISCILSQPKIWTIKITTLLLRSRLEANHKRTVARAMMQLQVLSDSLKETEIPFEERFFFFFISYLPPKWGIQSTLANVLVSMGSIKSALEIYGSLQDWENVIYCYNALQLRHKAQEIIEQELKKIPTPKLWCLLGDATDDVSCYEKAWTLSKKRSARAQRHWAYFYYCRKNYAECIEHFQKSLEINSLQKELWYRLGYAALMEEKWEISAHAYRRYCVLDPECFEAWNNLGRCYCELKQKYRAWKALQEALKVDYSKWKVWDNYMLVSSDLQAYDEVLKSYHEILNLKEKHLDIPVLNSLVVGFKSLNEGGKDDSRNVDRIKFRNKLLELFGRLTSQIINEAELWFLYSEVVETNTPENITKKYQLLMKAHRSAMNKTGWEQNLEDCNKAVYILSKMIEVGLLAENPNILMSCKLAATGVLSKIKKSYPDAGISELLEKNLEKVDKILES